MSESSPASPLLDVRDLDIRFRSRAGENHAVRGISFTLRPGRTLAIVGESGSGKSITALALTRLLPPPPDCRIAGAVHYDDRDLLALPEKQVRRYRGREIAYIFQEPSTSLNPFYSVGNQVAEAIKLHAPETKNIRAAVIEALRLVGIRQPEKRFRDFPHQMSGGMQQRVMIAMALACKPRILVADEPTTALDVTIQAQIIDLMRDLKDRLGTATILITHNFGIVDGFADDLVVLFRGAIVEAGPTERVLSDPRHPYTRALIDCIPKLGHPEKRLTTIDHAALDAGA
ncbi:MAG: ABC transporter ATP-binding protein [Opitutales bacterium]